MEEEPVPRPTPVVHPDRIARIEASVPVQGSDLSPTGRGKAPLKIRRPRSDESSSQSQAPHSGVSVSSNDPVLRMSVDDEVVHNTAGGSLLRRLSDAPTGSQNHHLPLPPLPSLKDRLQPPPSDQSYRPMDVDRDQGGRRNGNRRRPRR